HPEPSASVVASTPPPAGSRRPADGGASLEYNYARKPCLQTVPTRRSAPPGPPYRRLRPCVRGGADHRHAARPDAIDGRRPPRTPPPTARAAPPPRRAGPRGHPGGRRDRRCTGARGPEGACRSAGAGREAAEVRLPVPVELLLLRPSVDAHGPECGRRHALPG